MDNKYKLILGGFLFQFYHARRLVDQGLPHDALAYCEAVCGWVCRRPDVFSTTFMSLLYQVSLMVFKLSLVPISQQTPDSSLVCANPSLVCADPSLVCANPSLVCTDPLLVCVFSYLSS